MDRKTFDALQLIVEFALEVEYNDVRFGPKDVNRAAHTLAAWIHEVEKEIDD